jgi:hypothetical protein
MPATSFLLPTGARTLFAVPQHSIPLGPLVCRPTKDQDAARKRPVDDDASDEVGERLNGGAGSDEGDD